MYPCSLAQPPLYVTMYVHVFFQPGIACSLWIYVLYVFWQPGMASSLHVHVYCEHMYPVRWESPPSYVSVYIRVYTSQPIIASSLHIYVNTCIVA